MKNQNNYAKEAIKWNDYVGKVMVKVNNYVKSELSKGNSIESVRDGVYDILTKEKFDDKAVEFIYKSSKLANPSLTKAKFMKSFVKKKIDGKTINLFDNIDNKATTDRVMKRMVKDVGLVTDRANRIKMYKDRIGSFTDPQSLYDIKRTIETIGTRSKNIEGSIINVKRGLRNTSLFSSERKLLKNKLNDLNAQYKEEKSLYKSLKKEYDQLAIRKDNLPKAKFEQKLVVVLTKIEKDLTTRQVSFEINQTVKSSAGEPVKSTAKTEFSRETFEKELEKKVVMEETIKDDDVLMAQYTLNPSRTWVGTDECDDYAEADNGWGAGIYLADEVPSVPVHPQCGCEVSYFTMKRSEL